MIKMLMINPSADLNNPPPYPAFKFHDSQMESSSKEKNAPSSSHTNIKEGSQNAHHHSPNRHRRHNNHHYHHHNLNRALLFKVPRNNYNVQHSQKNLGPATSTSHGKTIPPSKFAHKSESRSERKEKASRKPDRIRSNTSVVIDVITCDARKMLCGLCSGSTSDTSVVAVLVCGHVYHADCLETRTHHEDRRDPSCPLCMSSLFPVDLS